MKFKTCGKNISKNACGKCLIFYCPQCDSNEQAKKEISWVKAIIGVLFLPIVFVLLLIDILITHGIITEFLFYKDQKCSKCGTELTEFRGHHT